MSTITHTVLFDGTEEWRLNGKLHRDNDEPAVIKHHGRFEWWYNDQRHRNNGPAIICPT